MSNSRWVQGSKLAAIAITGVALLGGPEASHHLRPHPAIQPSPGDPGIDGSTPKVLQGPPTVGPDTPAAGARSQPGADTVADARGIPATVLDAYRRAEARLAASRPGCRLWWPVLAGIGKVESDHARGGDVGPDGTTTTPILGPLLDGSGGSGAIHNTFGTFWAQSGPWARAVGPMQFLPSTWRQWGQDGNDDGRADPSNVYDAALAAGFYLCNGNPDLADESQLEQAVYGYNHSWDYVHTVLAWARFYASGASPVPDRPHQPGSDAAGNMVLLAAGGPLPREPGARAADRICRYRYTRCIFSRPANRVG